MTLQLKIKAVTEDNLDSRNFILCTDDCHSGTLVNEGHMNRVVRHAISQGLQPMTAIQMATLNTAQHFGMERELGSITPGRRADIILTSDLVELPIEQVVSRGTILADNGKLSKEIPSVSYPANSKNTINHGKSVEAQDFDIKAPDSNSSVKVRVIGVIENQAPTKLLQKLLKFQMVF